MALWWLLPWCVLHASSILGRNGKVDGTKFHCKGIATAS